MFKHFPYKIIQTWPSVEFMTCTELGDVISRKKQV
jgi:hypothetical protein